MASTTSSRACPAPRAKPARSNDKCIGRSEQTTKCLKMETTSVFLSVRVSRVERAAHLVTTCLMDTSSSNQQYMAWLCETPLCVFHLVSTLIIFIFPVWYELAGKLHTSPDRYQ
jgi:hypothetical protein